MIGEKLSPILEEIENTIWEFEAIEENNSCKPNYSTEGFRASIKIFMSALLDKMYDLQNEEDIKIEDRLNMAKKAGEDLRKLIKTYTDIDCHNLY